METIIKVDTGFGRAHSISVPLGAKYDVIKECCLAQTGENLFCVKNNTTPLEEIKYFEW